MFSETKFAIRNVAYYILTRHVRREKNNNAYMIVLELTSDIYNIPLIPV